MKVLIDSNIFLNVFNHESSEKPSFSFLEKVNNKKLEGFVSSVQLPEVYRSVFGVQGEDAAVSAILYTRNLTKVLPCSEETGMQAAPIYQRYKSANKKFSIIDAIIVATAQTMNADFIVTRDPDFNIVTEIKCAPPEKITS